MSYKSERLQGLRESMAGVETLRSLWPLAFPKKSHLVKPLASRVARQVAERTGWSPAYTRGVLQAWKSRSAYCYAVLGNERRSNLDGQEVAEIVDDEARKMARNQLARIAARRAKLEQKKAAAAAKPVPEMSNSAASPAG